MRRVLLRLTQPGEGAEDTRRRAGMWELLTLPEDAGAVERVVRSLSDARLLITRGSEDEVAHEALIRGWPQLRRWVEEDRQGLRTHRRLTEAAEEWESLNRDAGALYRGTRLAATVDVVRLRGEAERRAAVVGRRPPPTQIGDPIPGYGMAGFYRNALVSVGSAGGALWSPLLTNEKLEPFRRRICALTRRNLTQLEQDDFLPDRSFEPTC